jgi:hypothetical protein
VTDTRKPLPWEEIERSRYPKRRLPRKDAIKMVMWLGVISAVPISAWLGFGDTHNLYSLGLTMVLFVGFYLMPIVHYLRLE